MPLLIRLKTKIPKKETTQMNSTIIALYVKAKTARNIFADEEGQDLIEYALVVALISFAAVAGMNTVATNINTAFTSIGGKLTLYTS
jgi:pilus assembly protein Flp/PilA